ncbi:MAG: GAF domain-containing protein [Bacteroidales bacterium]|nr:GAF domain-containing protein [Bacteroidales bacterium]
MKLFEKGRRQIGVFLLVYLAVCIFVCCTSFPYLSLQTITMAEEIRYFSLFSMIVAIFVFFYTKQMFLAGGKIEDTVAVKTGQNTQETLRKEQERKAKEDKKKKAEQEKKIIEEKLSGILDGLDSKQATGDFFDQLLINLSKCFDIVQGVAYLYDDASQKFSIAGTYAYYTEHTDRTFEIGEGIPGQVAKDRKILQLDNVPEDYIKVVSGLGNSSPRHLVVIPIVSKDKTLAVMELASFSKTEINSQLFFEQFNEKLSGRVEMLDK